MQEAAQRQMQASGGGGGGGMGGMGGMGDLGSMLGGMGGGMGEAMPVMPDKKYVLYLYAYKCKYKTSLVQND